MRLLGIFGKRRNASLTSTEKTILDLLLAGEHKTLVSLRKQLGSPFQLWVEKKISDTQYIIRFIFDGNLLYDFTLGKDVAFTIADFVIEDNRLKMPIQFSLEVSHGVIVRMVGSVAEPVKLPKPLNIDGWYYLIDKKDGTFVKSKRRDLSGIWSEGDKEYLQSPSGYSAFQEWIMSLEGKRLYSANNDELHFSKSPGTSKGKISNIQRRLKVELPDDYKEFLMIANGGNFFGIDLLGAEDIYVLNDSELPPFLVFHDSGDGNFSAFRMDEGGELLGGHPVYYVCHDPFGFTKTANSFEEWIKSIESEIRIGT